MRHLWPIEDRIEEQQAQQQTTDAPLWTPQAGVQEAAFLCDADQIGYGGAAGGGKTDLALGMAITQHRRSIIFRRERTNARGIIERSKEIIGTAGRYNEMLHLWRFGHRTIEIGSLIREDDKANHQGQPRDLHVFDEATEFTETQVRFVIGWNRSATPGQRCRVLLTFNPPLGESQEWVIAFFAPWLQAGHADPAQDGDIRHVVMTDAGEQFYRPGDEPAGVEYKRRTFFHASLADNPALAAQGYAATIAAMPEPLRSAMRGMFNIAKGVDIWQVIPKAWVEAAQARWQPQTDEPLAAIGLDVARGGNDETSAARLYGVRYVATIDSVPGRLTPDGGSAAQVALAHHPSKRTPIGVDVIGVGGSAYDTLLGLGYDTRPMHAAEGSDATDKSRMLSFVNCRAAWWWMLREALDPEHGDNLALPPDPALLAELTAPKWRLQGRRILVESKDDIRKRLNRSTNRADAVIMALAARFTLRGSDLMDFI